MPGQDKTGPRGKGPGTGKEMGNCKESKSGLPGLGGFFRRRGRKRKNRNSGGNIIRGGKG